MDSALLYEARQYVMERAISDHANGSWGPASNLLERMDAALGTRTDRTLWPTPTLPRR